MKLLMQCFALVSILALGLWLGGCGQEAPSATPGPGVARLDAHRSLGAPVVAENLTVWPVYTDAPLDIGEFLTLQEAQERKLAVVRELGNDTPGNDTPGNDTPGNDTPGNDTPSQSHVQETPAAEPVQREGAPNDTPLEGPPRNGQVFEGPGSNGTIGIGHAAEVNRVVIENTGTLPILVVAGTIIDGGKQDRQIGQDFVIAAGTTVDVDAFCVEQGRWSEDEQTLQAGDTVSQVGFAPAGQAHRFSASKGAGIAVFGVRSAGQYDKSQEKVWAKVAGTLKKVDGAENGTQTLMGAMEKADEKAIARRGRLESAVLDAFAELARSDAPPVGFAYAVNGKPVTVRAFAHERILKSQLPLFVKAMAVEAEMAAGEKGADAQASAKDVIALVKRIEAAEEEMFETRADNSNGYSGNEFGFKARCVLKNGSLGLGKTVITEDWTAK